MASPRTRSLLFGTVVAVVALATAVAGALIAAGSAGDGSAEPGRFITADQPSLDVDHDEAEGEPVPDTTFERSGGGRGSFEDYRGRPLVVNFFASTCAPCIAEMPRVEEMHQRYGERVAFLGLAVQDSREDASRLVRRTGVTYDTGRDPAGEILVAFGSVYMPKTVFVTADGTVAEVRIGELSVGDLERGIQELLR